LKEVSERKAKAAGVLAQGTAECGSWVDAWHDDRVARGLTSARDSKAHWDTHIAAVLGSKHPKDWTRDDFRALSAALDAKVQRSEISPKTAVNVWTTATGMAGEAVSSKLNAIRCREDDPSETVKGPDRGDLKALQYLYPSEVDRFLSCEEVPIHWRRLVALAIYMYCRLGELRALTHDDIDLEHGTISLTKAIDRTSGGLKATKSKRPRRIPIERALEPLLQIMRKESGAHGPLLVEIPSDFDAGFDGQGSSVVDSTTGDLRQSKSGSTTCVRQVSPGWPPAATSRFVSSRGQGILHSVRPSAT
jgi:integrase